MKFKYDAQDEKLIVSESTRTEYHQIKLWLTRKVKGYKFMPAFKMGVWSGDQSYFDNGSVNLGLWKECALACKEIGTSFSIENKEDFPINRDVTLESVTDFCKDFFKNHKVKAKDGTWVPFMPYDYQIMTVYKVLKNRYCLAEVATSGGKSLIISMVYFYTLKNIDPNAKLLLIVPSITLVTQFYNDILTYNYGENFIAKYENDIDFRNYEEVQTIFNENPGYSPCDLRVEEIMSDKPRKFKGKNQPNTYIGCYQSLDKWPRDFFKQFHTVVVDESHQAKAETLKKLLKRTFKYAYNRFGVSGTFPPDESLEILTIQSLLGPKVNIVEAETLVKLGTITPMDIKVVVLNHNDKEFNDRMKWIKKNGNGKDVYQFEKEYVQNSQKRIDFISKLVSKCNDNTLILFHNIEHGQKLLNALVPVHKDKEFLYISGDIKNKEREEIKAKMEVNSDDIKVLIATYGTLSTGVSIKNIHNIIFIDSFKSESLVIQSIGRGLRKLAGKEKATIFDIVDVFDGAKMDNILFKQFKEREKFYNNRKYPYKITKINI